MNEVERFAKEFYRKYKYFDEDIEFKLSFNQITCRLGCDKRSNLRNLLKDDLSNVQRELNLIEKGWKLFKQEKTVGTEHNNWFHDYFISVKINSLQFFL